MVHFINFFEILIGVNISLEFTPAQHHCTTQPNVKLGRCSGSMMTSWHGTIPALLDICAGNSHVPGEFPSQRPVTQIFDVFFDLHLNKRLSKKSRRWWFETPSRQLRRHCNGCGEITVIEIGTDTSMTQETINSNRVLKRQASRVIKPTISQTSGRYSSEERYRVSILVCHIGASQPATHRNDRHCDQWRRKNARYITLMVSDVGYACLSHGC